MASTSTRKRPVAKQDRLGRYRAKRDFSITAEPSGTGPAPPPGARFVVQRHRATRLHYDVRLEIDGVLVSWAVPKGPTLDPDVKRMAMHVEDHPLDYFDFEGIIPAKEYGGGDAIVWDWGTWSTPDGADALEELERGSLHVDLHGEKLHGRFVFVRKGRVGRSKDEWLLLHKHDEHAVVGWDPEDHPRSVKSGRTNDEVRAAPGATWSSRGSWVAPTDDELAALDTLGKAGEWQLGEHTLKLTNLDKPLFPPRDRRRRPLTKRDLIRHHAQMAPVMLPYLAGRPVNMHRYPNVFERGPADARVAGSMTGIGRAHIGCSGWSYKDWRGVVYPSDAPARTWFSHYAQRFDTVEINNTFYRLPTESAVDGWAVQAPDGFCYAVKVGQFGSHRMKLKDAASWLPRHVERATRLGPHLGPNLLQLPPRWGRNLERLEEFLEAAPPSIRWAVELREPSWLHDDVFDLLARHGAALCIHDLLGDHPWELTTDWAYVRFHGPRALEEKYRGRYGGRRLGPVADRMQAWLDDGVDVYGYFNNDHEGHAAADASWLRKRLLPLGAPAASRGG